MSTTTAPAPAKPTLFTPIKVGDVELRNRIGMSALTRNRAVPDAIPNDVVAEYYKQRARSAGIIASEGVLVSPLGTTWPYAPGIWSEEQVEGWKKSTEAVHSVGGVIFAQLWHVGRIANNDMPEQKKAGVPVVSSSDVQARGYEGAYKHYGLGEEVGYSKPVPLEDPMTVVEDFRKAAINAKKAGFDGVELHGANGYLVHQFFDNTVNKRTDKWGGSAENRVRFGVEILKALVEVWGPGRVAVKISPGGGYNDVGMTLEDTKETFTAFIQEAIKLNIAYITVCNYFAYGDPKPDGKPRGIDHDVVETYGHLFKTGTTKFFNNTGLTPDAAKVLVESGKIDVAVFGMGWISNPDFARRVEKGLDLDAAPLFAHFYNGKDDDLGYGYTSYPDAA